MADGETQKLVKRKPFVWLVGPLNRGLIHRDGYMFWAFIAEFADGEHREYRLRFYPDSRKYKVKVNFNMAENSVRYGQLMSDMFVKKYPPRDATPARVTDLLVSYLSDEDKARALALAIRRKQ